MKKYLLTQTVEAEPAIKHEFEEGGHIISKASHFLTPEESKAITELPHSSQEGYTVVGADGNEYWTPKETFERFALPVTTNPKLKTDKPSISQEMVDSFILETWTETAGKKTTIVRAMLKNGYEIVEASSCVSPENYDEALGREICMKRIKNKIWGLLGFLLQTATYGVQGINQK